MSMEVRPSNTRRTGHFSSAVSSVHPFARPFPLLRRKTPVPSFLFPNTRHNSVSTPDTRIMKRTISRSSDEITPAPRRARGRGRGRGRGSALRNPISSPTGTGELPGQGGTVPAPGGSGTRLPEPRTDATRDAAGANATSGGSGLTSRRSSIQGSAEQDALMASLVAEKAELVDQLNSFKVRVNNLEDKCATQEKYIDGLISAVSTGKEKLTQVENENRSLKKLVDDVLKKNKDLTQKSGRAATSKVQETIPKQYLGIAYSVETRCGQWAANETREVIPFQDSNERSWQSRGIVTNEHGVDIGNGVLIAPLSPFKAASRGTYYTPSMESETDILQVIAREELKNEAWTEVFTTEESRNNVVSALSGNTALKSKIKQSLSDTCSGRKRCARDAFFSAFGYPSLHSRYKCTTAEDARSRDAHIEGIKEKVRRLPSRDPIMSFWRTDPDVQVSNIADMSEGTYSNPLGTESQGGVNAEDDDGEEEKMCIFKTTKALEVYHQFLGYRPKMDGTFSTTSILSLCRIDAWILTVIEHIDSGEGRGGKRQKVYSDTYGKFLELATSQLIGSISEFVEKWEPEELTVPNCDGSMEERKRAVLDMPREATKLIYYPSPPQWYISVESSWFKQFITDELGNIHDCYIASISSDFSSIQLLGSRGSMRQSIVGVSEEE